MQKQWPRKIQGSLRVELTGPALERFINNALNRGIHISRIVWLSRNRIRLTLSVGDYFQLRPVLKGTRTKSRILEKKGLPFWWMRLRRRQFFLWGFLLFILMIFSLTSVIWSVEVEGNETVPSKEIVRLLQKEGVYIGQLKSRVPSNEEIQYRLQSGLPQVSWVGFRMEGTRAVVTVVEKKRVDEREQQGNGPIQLVARRNAMIYDIRVERGRPLVEVNEPVKKGQLLVSGWYGDPDQPDSGKLVGAKGKVMGEVWYDSTVTVPLAQKRKVYTGNREMAWFPYVGSRMIRIPFMFPESFQRYETIRTTHALQIRNRRLPFGWVEEERLEMKWVHQKLGVKQAIALGKERAREDLMAKMGEDGRILGEKILHPRVVDGKVIMKIHFDAVENIAVSQPILQGD
ncbi:sporulation protein YqfD [Kroppenstedtia guangzhouensis]|uniref:Sporulation protein YqfD n=1 Tax=Kroppenstedtia guangzhouensis TaxID=1274356 RepID=A0ABQ1G2S5_9BACL|nr:sporulation protein YqfD [Kroppenstedtia guangzhouensis]GGA36378.1 sporulation protein YqfD [Kroppenstedtia guangzhouensis]